MSNWHLIQENPIVWLIMCLATLSFAVMLHYLTLFSVKPEQHHKALSWLSIMPTLLAALPLLGLLGTIIGLLNTFAQMAKGSIDLAQLLSGGIADALLTTQIGLVTAIPGLVMLALLKRRTKYWKDCHAQ